MKPNNEHVTGLQNNLIPPQLKKVAYNYITAGKAIQQIYLFYLFYIFYLFAYLLMYLLAEPECCKRRTKIKVRPRKGIRI